MSKQIIRNTIDMGRTALANTAQAVPEDKLNWKPLENGRSVLDLLGDAAQGPLLGVTLLTNRDQFSLSRELFQQMKEERAKWSRDESLAQLNKNTDALLQAIDALAGDRLDEPVTLPMGHDVTLPLGNWLMMVYRVFAARTAQINYIQTLYGDFEGHEFQH